MRFKRNFRADPGLNWITIVSLFNILFLSLTFFLLSSSFTFPSSMGVKLPRAVTSDTVQEDTVIITLTGEDIIYFNNKIATIPEITLKLKAYPAKPPILIKADRRSSVGRIIDIWNLCRDLEIERVNIATTQEN